MSCRWNFCLRNVRSAKCLSANCLSAKCLSAKCLSEKCLSAKCPSTSYSAYSTTSAVSHANNIELKTHSFWSRSIILTPPICVSFRKSLIPFCPCRQWTVRKTSHSLASRHCWHWNNCLDSNPIKMSSTRHIASLSTLTYALSLSMNAKKTIFFFSLFSRNFLTTNIWYGQFLSSLKLQYSPLIPLTLASTNRSIRNLAYIFPPPTVSFSSILSQPWWSIFSLYCSSVNRTLRFNRTCLAFEHT